MQKIKERLFGAVVFLALAVIFVPMFFSENNKKINLTDMQMKEPVVNAALKPILEPENLVVLNQLEKPSFDGAVAQPYQDAEALAVHEPISANEEATRIQNTLALLDASPSQAAISSIEQGEDTSPSTAITNEIGSATKTDDVVNPIQADQKTTLSKIAAQQNKNDLLKESELKTGAQNQANSANPSSTKTDSRPATKKPRITEISSAWVVQLATFKEGANADSLVKKLQKDGYPAYSKSMQNSQGAYTLVLVGPKVGKTEADSLKIDLKTKYRLQGVVIQHQPTSS